MTLIIRRMLIALGAAAIAMPQSVLAHHGWRWTADGTFELTGIIIEARLGNPHGVLTVDAEGEVWLAEVGQPWRNARAGLTDSMLQPGAELTLQGHRDADESKLRMKAERIVIAGKLYNLYPDRS